MRRHVVVIAMLSLFPVDVRGFETFYVPVVPVGSVRQEIAGVLVGFEWNTAASVPTVFGIWPEDLAKTPMVLSRGDSATEVAASVAEFVDAHPEWFRVSSTNLDIRPHASMGGRAWTVNSSLFYQGVLVLGGYVQLVATTEGGLLLLEARLFPEVDLGGLSTETPVSSEGALGIALGSQDYLAPMESSAPEKVIAFHGTEPFMAWRLEVDDTRDRSVWSFLIDGTTGEIMGVGNQALALKSMAFVRGDANGDRTMDIADSIAILSTLFLDARGFSCPDAADVNDDGRIDVSDGVYGLNYLFLGGAPPPKPFPNPGPDITQDPLGCPIVKGRH